MKDDTHEFGARMVGERHLGIQGREGVIQEDDISICICCPCKGDALLLTSTHIHSPVPQLCKIAGCIAECQDILSETCNTDCSTKSNVIAA